MSYPQARYVRPAGAASASYRPTDRPPELVFPSGNTADYLATGATTDGLFGLYRWNMGPQPGGPRPHFHRTIAESFYVLFGRVRIFDGREWIDAGAGDFVHVPAGGIHGFSNDSGAPAQMLIHFAPGAPREAYFEALARFGTEGWPEGEELEAFFAAHDQYHV